MAPYTVENVVAVLKEHNIRYIGVASDGSNHKSIKLFPIVIQYFDWEKGGLQSKLKTPQMNPLTPLLPELKKHW